MITSLSVGDVIDLKSDGGLLIATLGFPSYPATFLVLTDPCKLFDKYWNQNVWVTDLLNLSNGQTERFTVFKAQVVFVVTRAVDNVEIQRIFTFVVFVTTER